MAESILLRRVVGKPDMWLIVSRLTITEAFLNLLNPVNALMLDKLNPRVSVIARGCPPEIFPVHGEPGGGSPWWPSWVPRQ